MTSFVDGRALKLRASCDACNEAKVRCSQTKPTCARCEKNDIPCIYGLSRRSHKNAPRIGSSHESAPTHSQSRNRTIQPPDNASISSPSSFSPLSGICSQPETPLHIMSPPAAPISHASQDVFSSTIPPNDLMADSTKLFSSLGQAQFDFSLDPEILDAASEFLDFPATNDTKNIGDNSLESLNYPVHMEFETQTHHSCRCVSRLIEELGSMSDSSVSHDRSVSFDAQLSQLRRIINITEDCVTCPCITQDEMSIMTTSILIGRILQGLEASLTRTYPASSSSSSTSSSTFSAPNSLSNLPSAPQFDVPKLRLGELQIDPDEENQLKLHLWLLQFRKLGKVITAMSNSVHQVTASNGRNGESGNGAGGSTSAHAMACQCIHMWLVQKTDALKARYDAKEGEIGIGR